MNSITIRQARGGFIFYMSEGSNVVEIVFHNEVDMLTEVYRQLCPYHICDTISINKYVEPDVK